MNVILEHSIVGGDLDLYTEDFDEIFRGVDSIDTFMKQIRKFGAKKYNISTKTDQTSAPFKNYLKLVGSMFEVFGEFLIKGHPYDDRFYISDYEYRDIIDNGVDAYAKDSRDGRNVYIQYKCYNDFEFLTGHKSRLDSFMAEVSMLQEDLEDANPDQKILRARRLVITTAPGIHEYTKDVKYRHRVQCINRADLQQLCDKNPKFWTDFRAAVGCSY